MYKIYEFNYINAGTQEYHCREYRITDNPEEMQREFEKNRDYENVYYEEYSVKGFKIKIEKI